MGNKIYTIQGIIKRPIDDGSNSYWYLNGDIEINKEG